MSDYLSSDIDLDDYIHKDMGCTQRDDGPKEVKNHHAPLSQGARNRWAQRAVNTGIDMAVKG